MEPIKIFFCYAHEDESLRRELEKHLSALRRSGKVVTWHDQNISPGASWQHEIEQELNTANIILLLISQNFLASEYCYNVEMRKALERHKAGKARVIPIILRSVPDDQPLLSGLPTLPASGPPVTRWHNQDDAFLNVCKGIQKVVAELKPTEELQSSGKLTYGMQALGLKEHKGALIVYADKMLRGKTVDLYEGSHSDGKLHSSSNVVEQKMGERDLFLAIFPSLNPNDYTAFIDWKYYARATVSANQVVEIDWRRGSPLSNLQLTTIEDQKEESTLENKPLKRWWQFWK